jgi:two-component system, NarL family, nitrate/nitrite response regulator NarL
MRSQARQGAPTTPSAEPACAAPRQPVRVAIASNVRLVREGLSLGLAGRPDIVVVGAAGMEPPGLDRIGACAPDVVLADLGGGDAVGIGRRLRAACPGAKLVTFALAEVEQDVFACAAAGFAGYVPQDGGEDELHRAVLDVVDGRLRCAPHIASAMFRRLSTLLRPEPAQPPLTGLTPREGEILAMVEQGCSNKDIARRLDISTATVKNHIHNILQKLQISRRGEASARLRLHRAP